MCHQAGSEPPRRSCITKVLVFSNAQTVNLRAFDRRSTASALRPVCDTTRHGQPRRPRSTYDGHFHAGLAFLSFDLGEGEECRRSFITYMPLNLYGVQLNQRLLLGPMMGDIDRRGEWCGADASSDCALFTATARDRLPQTGVGGTLPVSTGLVVRWRNAAGFDRCERDMRVSDCEADAGSRLSAANLASRSLDRFDRRVPRFTVTS